MHPEILAHDSKVIREALKNNTFNVYLIMGGDASLKKRVFDVRMQKGSLQVRLMHRYVDVYNNDQLVLQ